MAFQFYQLQGQTGGLLSYGWVGVARGSTAHEAHTAAIPMSCTLWELRNREFSWETLKKSFICNKISLDLLDDFCFTLFVFPVGVVVVVGAWCEPEEFVLRVFLFSVSQWLHYFISLSFCFALDNSICPISYQTTKRILDLVYTRVGLPNYHYSSFCLNVTVPLLNHQRAKHIFFSCYHGIEDKTLLMPSTNLKASSFWDFSQTRF